MQTLKYIWSSGLGQDKLLHRPERKKTLRSPASIPTLSAWPEQLHLSLLSELPSSCSSHVISSGAQHARIEPR